jgi:hypothetical protein
MGVSRRSSQIGGGRVAESSGAGGQRHGCLSRRDRGPRGDRGHVELRRLEDVAFDRALIHGPQDRLAVLLREGRRKQDLQPDARDALTGFVPPGCELESETLRVEIALPEELERVEAGAGADGREEEVERSRGESRASCLDGMVREDRESLVERFDFEAPRKLSMPGSMGRASLSRLM